MMRRVTEIDENLSGKFNSMWTYEEMKDRRVELMMDILQTLQFDPLDDEFGMEASKESIYETIRGLTEEEFEKRTSLQSL